ncbi:MAG: M23 family metallopeptidase [Pseudomonadota bacterium]
MKIKHAVLCTLYAIILLSISSCGPIHSYIIDIKGGVYHKVTEGVDLDMISKAYKIAKKDIIKANKMTSLSVAEGDLIFIPGADRLIRIDQAISKPAKRNTYKPPVAKKEKAIPKSTLQFISPVSGNITSKYGYRSGKKHHGIDIKAAKGSKIKACAAGVVVYSGSELEDYGNLVIIKHEQDFTSVYAHNSKNLVKEGDKVQKGDYIAEVGNTGNAENNHLHFELRSGVESIDPESYINF